MATLEPGSIPQHPRRLSVDEYMELPNDGKRYQILEGELDVTPAPTPRHQRISRRLQFILMTALEKTGLGEVFNAPIDLILDRHNVVQPDLLYIRKARLEIVGEKNIQGVPDLIVEILSPSTRRVDVLVKSDIYARFQIPSYWIVDPDVDRIEVYQLEQGRYALTQTASGTETLEPPGLAVSLPLRDIFG